MIGTIPKTFYEAATYQGYFLKMLGTFPKDFSQVATSQGYISNWQLVKCAISQAATSQVYPSRSARPPIAAPQRA